MSKEKFLPINLLLLLKKHKITQKKLAEKINAEESVVSNWLTGKTKPTEKSISKLISLFKLPKDYFFCDFQKEDNENNNKKLKVKDYEISVLKDEIKFLKERIKFLEKELNKKK
ncbi:MAG: helix-turn-helix transcriptional regulator [Elusimicrobia bacterium]|nr:helix-turn-helix transcriptional regulator [Elusimicrobiota bacterium]